MRGRPNFKTRSDLESTDERLHNDMKQNAEYVCFRSFYPKGNLKTLFVLKLELPPRAPGYDAWLEHDGCSGCFISRRHGSIYRIVLIGIPLLYASSYF
jgi:hypothetical protein